MQHKQFNFVWQAAKMAALTVALVAAWPALAGTIAQPSKPDPLLDGGPTDPCAAGVDYADAVDASGQAVIPADVAARPVPVPDAIAIPLGGNRPAASSPPDRGRAGRRADRGFGNSGGNPVTPGGDSTYISLDGRKLEPLLNPLPCRPVH